MRIMFDFNEPNNINEYYAIDLIASGVHEPCDLSLFALSNFHEGYL